LGGDHKRKILMESNQIRAFEQGRNKRSGGEKKRGVEGSKGRCGGIIAPKVVTTGDVRSWRRIRSSKNQPSSKGGGNQEGGEKEERLLDIY